MEIKLEDIIEILRKYQSATYGCGNGRIEFEKAILEIQMKYNAN